MINPSSCLNISMMANFIRHFNLVHPLTIEGPLQVKLNLTKHFFGNQQFVTFEDMDKVKSRICGQDQHRLGHIVLKDRNSVILAILNHSTFDNVLENFICSINEEVYLLNENTGHVFETYFINNVKIKRKVAFFDTDLKIIWTEPQSMIKRRSNFHGIHLKSLTGPSGDNVRLDSKYSSEALYFPNNETYDISNHVSGIIIDIVSIMTNNLNFTTNYFMRKDRKWGTVIKYSNGTLGGVGTVSDLFHGKADIIAGPLSITMSRMPYIQYLPTLNFTMGKLLENNNVSTFN